MVLQRGETIPISGHAKPGTQVRVSFAGTSVRSPTNQLGNWAVELPAFEAGGPHVMRIEADDEVVRFDDVLIGDVWLAGGQSNMEWPISNSAEPGRAIAESEDLSEIRFLRVSHTIAQEPKDSVSVSAWRRLDEQSANQVSAVAFSFAREIHRAKGVPIGVIQAPWGGTPIEPWMPRWSFDRSERLHAIRARAPWISDNIEQWGKQFDRAFKDVMDRPSAELRARTGPGPREGWRTVEVPAAWERQIGPRDGVAWLAVDVDIDRADLGLGGSLSLGPIDDFDRTYINGVLVGTTGRGPVDPWLEPRVYKIKPGILKAGMNTIAVQVLDTGGGGGLHGRSDELRLTVGTREIPLAGEWEILFDRTGRDIAGFPYPTRSRNRNYAGGMYNAMIAPFDRVPITGVIWYQGESNAGRPGEYEELFETLITSWREIRDDPDMPFLFVQLASFRKRADLPTDTNWARLREAQASVLDLPNTGMAVALDVGDADDIHPRDKRTVGTRLALAALDVAYDTPTRWRGPMPRTFRFLAGRVRIEFSDDAELMTADGAELCGFAIAGADGVFHWAEAVIEGSVIVLTSETVAEPRYVRYGWADNPCANLVGAGNLPAPPFRTDALPPNIR
ncbi:MAG: sialate O-acetylesterase [Planctomycetota bacterium]